MTEVSLAIWTALSLSSWEYKRRFFEISLVGVSFGVIKSYFEGVGAIVLNPESRGLEGRTQKAERGLKIVLRGRLVSIVERVLLILRVKEIYGRIRDFELFG